MLKHKEIKNLYNKDNQIFDYLYSSESHSELQLKIKNISNKYLDFSYSSKEKMLGDLYEIFVELFLNIINDDRVRIRKYIPIQNDDYGVDGLGKSDEDENVSIQIKFRSNPTDELSADDIKQFPYQSIVKYGINFNSSLQNMILITNCKGIKSITLKKVFLDRIRIINGEHIDGYTNNKGFWLDSLEKINETIKLPTLFKPNDYYLINNEVYITGEFSTKENKYQMINIKTEDYIFIDTFEGLLEPNEVQLKEINNIII